MVIHEAKPRDLATAKRGPGEFFEGTTGSEAQRAVFHLSGGRIGGGGPLPDASSPPVGRPGGGQT
ncbi:MAG: hypothetical protein R6U98_36580, partial [Pirellulaceae bacterium]